MERQIVLWHSKLGTDPSGGPGLSGPKKKNGPLPKSWIIDLVHINLKKKMQIQKNVNPVVQMEKWMKKKKRKRKIERQDRKKEARETYRIESRHYKEKLRGERERESEMARPILPPPTPPPRETEDPSRYPRRHHTRPISLPWRRPKWPHQCCHVRPIMPLVDRSA